MIDYSKPIIVIDNNGKSREAKYLGEDPYISSDRKQKHIVGFKSGQQMNILKFDDEGKVCLKTFTVKNIPEFKTGDIVVWAEHCVGLMASRTVLETCWTIDGSKHYYSPSKMLARGGSFRKPTDEELYLYLRNNLSKNGYVIYKNTLFERGNVVKCGDVIGVLHANGKNAWVLGIKGFVIGIGLKNLKVADLSGRREFLRSLRESNIVITSSDETLIELKPGKIYKVSGTRFMFSEIDQNGNIIAYHSDKQLGEHVIDTFQDIQKLNICELSAVDTAQCLKDWFLNRFVTIPETGCVTKIIDVAGTDFLVSTDFLTKNMEFVHENPGFIRAHIVKPISDFETIMCNLIFARNQKEDLKCSITIKEGKLVVWEI